MNLDEILTKHSDAVKEFEDGNDISDALYEDLYEYYLLNGEMPYGTAKARDGDPYEWIGDRLYNYLNS